MAITYINTNQCVRVKLPEQRGAVAEIVNRDLCGAENLIGMLRWLDEGERFDVEFLKDKHQLIYLMEGQGIITLESREYQVSQGAGIYLGPCETASVRQAGAAPLKLLHLVVRKEGENAI